MQHVNLGICSGQENGGMEGKARESCHLSYHGGADVAARHIVGEEASKEE